MHTLSSAARAVGTAKSTIYRAVKAGRLSAHKLTSGTYAIYPGELRRAFPLAPSFKTEGEERESFGFPVWDVS
jgi:excisionase family DNA binding protein